MDPKNTHDPMSDQIAKKEQRKINNRNSQDRSVWFGLGMFGLVGWSVAIPTLIGIAIGVWIDRTWRPGVSFTLMTMFIGIVAGCLIAWYWVKRESLGVESLNNGSQGKEDNHN